MSSSVRAARVANILPRYTGDVEAVVVDTSNDPTRVNQDSQLESLQESQRMFKELIIHIREMTGENLGEVQDAD